MAFLFIYIYNMSNINYYKKYIKESANRSLILDSKLDWGDVNTSTIMGENLLGKKILKF